MIRIVYLLDALGKPLGGTERQFLTLLRSIDPGRFETRLILLRDDGGPEDPDVPCPTERLHCRSFARPAIVRAGREFTRSCRDMRADIVHTALRDASKIGPLWARMAGVPVVVGSRRNLGYLRTGPDRVLSWLLGGLTTHIVANSHAAARETSHAERYPISRISVIRNGLDPSVFDRLNPADIAEVRKTWGFPADALVVGAVANLRPVKRLSLLVEAAGAIAPRFPRARFVILGEGGERPRLESMIRERHLEARFVLPGASDRAATEIQAFDVGVLTSDSESSPNALIEYLAAGIPAVSTDVGGAGEIVIAGTSGFLVPPGDSRALEQRVTELLADGGLRSRMGAAARREAQERFPRDLMVTEHESLYETLVHASRGS